MTIQEAILSGKRFRRPHHGSWYVNTGKVLVSEEGLKFILLTESILAKDWVVDWAVQESSAMFSAHDNEKTRKGRKVKK